MFRFKIDTAKRFFFDSDYVAARVSKAKRKVLSMAGAFIRRTARRLITKRKSPSKPGRPPTSWTGILKRFIFFAYDPQNESVIVGPAKTNQIFFDGDGEPVSGTVPSVLEYGGEITISESLWPGVTIGGLNIPPRWQRTDFRYRRAGTQADFPRRRRTIHIEARPSMGPSLDENLPKFPDLWSDSVGPS